MPHIDEQSNNRPHQDGQPDGLRQLNPSATDEIVRRGQEALQRLSRSYEDWTDIAEAVAVGRTEAMAAAHTNKPTGKRYEKEMADWLRARSFHLIDKGTRNRLLECLKHRVEIEKWRATLTEGERFRFNHPDTVLKKWKAKTIVPDPSAPLKTSPITKLKETNIDLQEKLYRAERELARGGGDLWTADDTAENIADVMLAKLTISKAERLARTILTKLKELKKAAPKKPAAQDTAASAEERKAMYAAEIESPVG